jgi:hypothetical protein
MRVRDRERERERETGIQFLREADFFLFTNTSQTTVRPTQKPDYR